MVQHEKADAIYNMWLAGWSFDEIFISPTMRSCDPLEQQVLRNALMRIEWAFDHTCAMSGIVKHRDDVLDIRSTK